MKLLKMESKILIFEDPEEFLKFIEGLQEEYISASAKKEVDIYE